MDTTIIPYYSPHPRAIRAKHVWYDSKLFLYPYCLESSFVEFSRDVYRELLAQGKHFLGSLLTFLLDGTNSDLFFSPLSIYSALSLAFAGSATKSREEFLTVFHLTEQGEDTNLSKMLGDGWVEVHI